MLSSLTIDDLTNQNIDDLELHPIFEEEAAIPLSNDNGDIRNVRTFREYKEAIRDGYFAVTTISIKAATGLLEPFGAIISLLKQASVPEESYIEAPRAGVTSLDLLPADILASNPDPADVSEQAQAGETVRDLVARGAAQIDNVGADFVSIIHGPFYNLLTEVMRADLDGDGVEDLLVESAVHATGGTMGWTSLYIVRRRGPDSLFEVEEHDPLQAERAASA
jgi:hypothetical protein